MKRILSVAIMFIAGIVSTVSAQDMRTVFLNAPDAVFPLLSKSYRADMVDFIEAGMQAKVTNRLDGVSVLEELGHDYLRLATTASSSLQLKLLPFGGDTIICAVKSVKAESADSRILFYDREWRALAGEKFCYPSVADFFVSPEAAADNIALCDIYLVSLTLSATDNTLVAEYTMPAYMDVDAAAKVGPLLRKIVYRWNGVRFVTD